MAGSGECGPQACMRPARATKEKSCFVADEASPYGWAAFAPAKGLCSAGRNALHRDFVFLGPPPRLDHSQYIGLRWPVVFGRCIAGGASGFRRATGWGFPALLAHDD